MYGFGDRGACHHILPRFTQSRNRLGAANTPFVVAQGVQGCTVERTQGGQKTQARAAVDVVYVTCRT